MDIHTVNTHLMPFTWYRIKDFAKQEGCTHEAARYWLNKLVYGGIVHLEKRGKMNLYITNQDRLI